MSEFSWDTLEPQKQESPLTGPEQILSGKGCRVIMKTTEDEAVRSDNLVARLYRTVSMLERTDCPGVSAEPRDGYVRIYGGEPPLYVQGTDQKAVITTIGKGVLSAAAPLREQLAELGIRALVEW